jgi:hypothetical protein
MSSFEEVFREVFGGWELPFGMAILVVFLVVVIFYVRKVKSHIVIEESVLEMPQSKTLYWRVTEEEFRKRFLSFVTVVAVPFTLLLLFAYVVRIGVSQDLFVAGGVLLLCVSLFFFWRWLVYKKHSGSRQYELSKDRVLIKSGEKVMFSGPINNFSSFSLQVDEAMRSSEKPGKIEESPHIVAYKIFLSKKPATLWDRLFYPTVIIRTNRENADDVIHFLRAHIQKETVAPGPIRIIAQ